MQKLQKQKIFISMLIVPILDYHQQKWQFLMFLIFAWVVCLMQQEIGIKIIIDKELPVKIHGY